MTIFDRFKTIKAFVLQFDGVLTDGRILVQGYETTMTHIHFRDKVAIRIANNQGYPILGILNHYSHNAQHACDMLDIPETISQVRKKEDRLTSWMKTTGVDPASTLYIGNDVPDLGCMRL